jgi:DHA2 family multidrug resistance protein-like MFS transporter
MAGAKRRSQRSSGIRLLFPLRLGLMSENETERPRLPDRVLARVPERYRDQVPPEIPAIWEDPERLRVLMASVVAMFALAIFPPYFSPGAEAIQTTLKDDPTSLGLVVLAGIALGAGAILFGGAVGDTSGHRRWLLVGLAGLLLTSLFGVATGEAGLMAAALLGAFWSGFAMPLGIAIVADAYSERAVQDMGIGLGLGAMAVAQIVAPIIQDAMADIVGLWAIWVLPIVTAAWAIYLVRKNVAEQVIPEALRKRDVLGQALFSAVPLTIATFVIVLLPGEADWLALSGLAVLGAIGAIAFIVRRRRGRGLVPAAAAPGRMILVAMFVGVFMSFAVNAPMQYFGSFLRIIREWGEIAAMAALIPHFVPMLLGGIWAPLLAYRYGYVRVILASMLLLAFSTSMFALAANHTTYWWFILPLATLGLGMIFGATARAGLIMSRMPKALPALANALNLAAMELGAILGSTLMTVMMMRFATEDYSERLAGAAVESSVAKAAVSDFREALRSVTPGGTTEIPPERVEALLPGFREAMANGLSFSLWLVTLVTIAATIAAAFLFRWARGRDERPESPIQTVPPGVR